MQNEQFLSAYQQIDRHLYAFAMRLTGDRMDADDLLQETASRAFRAREQFRPDTNFKAWITTIMRNTFINDYRKKRRAPKEAFDLQLPELNRPDWVTYNASESNIQVEELTNLVQRLKEKYRIPFLMYYEGYSYQEIADEMGIVLGTVKSRIHVARHQLKEMVVEMGEEVRVA